MGNTILIRPDGSTIEAPDEDVAILEKAGFRRDTGSSWAARNTEQTREEHYSGQKFDTLVEGAASGLTLGLSDVAARFGGSADAVADMEGRAEFNPTTRMIGEIGGAIVSAIPTGGESLLAKSPTAMLNRTAATVGAGMPGRATGLLAEGAILGVGGAVEHANVTGDPLTIEAVIEGAGVGGLLNYGAGVLGDRVMKTARGVAEEKATLTRLQQESEQAALAGKTLKDPPSSWGDVVESHRTFQRAIKTQNDRMMADARVWADATAPDSVRSSIHQFKTGRNEITSRIGETQYAKGISEGEAAAKRASREYTKELRKFNEGFTDDVWDKTIQRYDDAINHIDESFSPTVSPVASNDPVDHFVAAVQRSAKDATPGEHWTASVFAGLPKEYRTQGLEQFELVLGELEKRGKVSIRDLQTPRTAIDGDLKIYRETLERAKQLRGNPEAAVGELNSLKGQFEKWKIDTSNLELPKVPTKPEGFVPPGIELSDAVALGRAAKDLDVAISRAQEHLKAGDGPSAIGELRAAKARIHAIPGLEDLRLPALPHPSGTPADIESVRLPKSIREFAKMRVDNPKLEKLAKAAETNQGFAAALERLANDLGVEASGGIRAIHKSLNETLAHTEKVAGSLKDTAEGRRGWSLIDMLRRKSKVGLVAGAARAADVGGWKGAMTRALVGGAVGYAADGAEGAVLGATLTSAKMGARSKIRNLVAKLAEGRPASLAKMLKPVTVYLHQPIIDTTGEAIDDALNGANNAREDRAAASARIGEILRAQYTARDQLYTAIEPMMGAPGDVAFKIFNQAVNMVNHLAMTVPKDPGIDITPAGSKWTPSHEKTHELAARIEAVKDPMGSLMRSIAGRGHYAATETLWACYPAWMQEVSTEIALAAPNLNLTYEEGSALSKIFRVPMTGLQHQAVVTTLQGYYLPQPQPNQPGGSPSNPVGRPAAVQSPVAGSSVAGLTQ